MSNKSAPVDLFYPRDGSILDRASFEALAAGPNRILGSLLGALVPGSGGLVLEGLEVQAPPSSEGPPGTVQPDIKSRGLAITPGSALLTDTDGTCHLVHVPEPLFAPWPTEAGASIRRVAMVLLPRISPAAAEGGIAVSRAHLYVELGFVRVASLDPHLHLVLALAGEGGHWSTDHARLWQPEHPALRRLMMSLERIEKAVWSAEPPMGDRHTRQTVGGADWQRNQLTAVAAFQAARVGLLSRATTTRERVRLLSNLRRTLQSSVRESADALIQVLGSSDFVSPYQEVLDLSRADSDGSER